MVATDPVSLELPSSFVVSRDGAQATETARLAGLPLADLVAERVQDEPGSHVLHARQQVAPGQVAVFLWQVSSDGRSHWSVAEDTVEKARDGSAEVVGTEDVVIGPEGYAAVKIVTETGGAAGSRGVTYVVDGGHRTWILDFAVPQVESGPLSALVDRAADSFRRPYQTSWERISGEGMSISLPSTFEVARDRRALEELEGGLGPRATRALRDFSGDAAEYRVVIAAQRLPDDRVAAAKVVVVPASEVGSHDVLAAMIKASIEDRGLRLVLHRRVRMDRGYAAVRIDAVEDLPRAGEYRTRAYVVDGGDRIWLVSFNAPNDDFADLSAAFGQSADTFTRAYVKPWKTVRADGVSMSVSPGLAVTKDPAVLAADVAGPNPDLATYLRDFPQFFVLSASGPSASSLRDGRTELLVWKYPMEGSLEEVAAQIREGHRPVGRVSPGSYVTVGQGGYSGIRLDGWSRDDPGYRRVVYLVEHEGDLVMVNAIVSAPAPRAGLALVERTLGSLTMPGAR